MLVRSQDNEIFEWPPGLANASEWITAWKRRVEEGTEVPTYDADTGNPIFDAGPRCEASSDTLIALHAAWNTDMEFLTGRSTDELYRAIICADDFCFLGEVVTDALSRAWCSHLEDKRWRPS